MLQIFWLCDANNADTDDFLSQRSIANLCVPHELHEYDQDEDSSKACHLRVLLFHDVSYILKSSGSDGTFGLFRRELISG